jgi:hypothetical protein
VGLPRGSGTSPGKVSLAVDKRAGGMNWVLFMKNWLVCCILENDRINEPFVPPMACTVIYVKISHFNDAYTFQLTGRNLGSSSNCNGLDLSLAGHEFSEDGACCIRIMC